MNHLRLARNRTLFRRLGLKSGKRPRALAFAAFALLAGVPAQATEPPIYGVWLRDEHDERLEFYDCDGKLCAREDAVVSAEGGGPPQIILRSATKTGNNQWKGDLFNPENGKTYNGKIHYNPPDQLTLTGCLVAFLCQSETWTRSDRQPANSPAAPPPAPPPPARGKTK
jgi:uncharacterized protein (DUF2147 family)